MKMKKNMLLFLMILIGPVLFSQNAKYKELYSKAKEYESAGKYVWALGTYWDALEADSISLAAPALDDFNRIASIISSGKPGKDIDYDDFDMFEGWESLCNDWYDYSLENFLFLIDIENPKKESLDYTTKSAKYSIKVGVYKSEKYEKLRSVIKVGYDKKKRNDWKNLWKENGTANIEISFRIETKDGTVLIPERKTKIISNYSSYDIYNTVTVDNVTRDATRILDSGEYVIKPLSVKFGNKLVNLSTVHFSDNVEGTKNTNILTIMTAEVKKYVTVEGGTFQMGNKDGYDDEKPVHSVTLNSFIMGTTEVTQGQYQSLMGSNPSVTKGKREYGLYVDENWPVENVSWYDAVEYCNALSERYGLRPCYSKDSNGNWIWDKSANGWRLPTEAEWEYAARGGNKSKNYKYSGSNDIYSVANYRCIMGELTVWWEHFGELNRVASKEANELGLYDMSGNVMEWCWDWYDSNYYRKSPSINPTGPSSGTSHVVRGGGWDSWESSCCVWSRSSSASDLANCDTDFHGFRIVRYSSEEEIADVIKKEQEERERLEQARLEEERIEKERLEQERLEKERIEKERLEQERLEKERIEKKRLEQERLERLRREKIIKDLLSSFVYVEGGQFKMGSSSGEKDEKPVHKVTVSSFDMAETEVTQEQWTAIMGDNPSSYNGNMRPVNNVSWYEAIVFCNKLSILDDKIPVYSVNGQTDPENWNYSPCHGDSIRGTVVMNINANGYRLPTEAEWEYAARGGKKTKGYKYSGSNKLKDVAWYSDNSGSQIHDVATKSPNELGLYDMSGNVWEWCWDWYGSYSNNAQTNPVGASSGSYRVLRGGSWYGIANGCSVAFRYYLSPGYGDFILGFRLVRSAQ